MHVRSVLYVASWGIFASIAQALWPQPQSISSGTSVLTLASDFAIHLSIDSAPQDLGDAVSRTMSRLRADRLERLVVGRASADATLLSNATSIPGLSVSLAPGVSAVQSIATEARKPLSQRVEAYHLVVPHDGSGAVLTANTSLGLLRGLTTFEQLWYYGGSEHPNTTYTLSAPLEIVDSAAYVGLHCCMARKATY